MEELDPNHLSKLLDHALQYGTVAELLDLFEKGMNIDQTDFEGRTALQLISARGKKDIAERLISKGADVNAVFMYQGRIPMTALDAAFQSGNQELINLLLSLGAKKGNEVRR